MGKYRYIRKDRDNKKRECEAEQWFPDSENADNLGVIKGSDLPKTHVAYRLARERNLTDPTQWAFNPTPNYYSAGTIAVPGDWIVKFHLLTQRYVVPDRFFHELYELRED